jgi:hypothetical protein
MSALSLIVPDVPQVNGRAGADPQRGIEQFLNVAAKRGVRRGDPDEIPGPDVA